MVGPSTPSTARSVHRLVEHYTPQGTVGRLLLGVVALGVSPVLILGAAAGMSGPLSLFPFLVGLLALVGGVVTAVVGVLTLWPVYLSLIGNVDSAADYMNGTGRSASANGSRVAAASAGSEPASDEADLDAEELLKRRYAAGDLSREEFERRLDTLLDRDGRRAAGGRGEGRREREREPERE
ncbi:SHOCT domain-containing protein [Candidatus Halobonum tyrrellensis]|uniref:SHOCT domain-containing protein n=1 Tax=Candidatus Halobonum tyrrellensis G22 TaxID=1324957 RepID=V4IZC3_9EURY|nr:SHOCT domain-containing protein [Candidatus Halobonum tyrrellensis]ESP88472.1 hypothetical protein K933_08432 [Candidatus Halobonum tyrrellensis G22]